MALAPVHSTSLERVAWQRGDGQVAVCTSRDCQSTVSRIASVVSLLIKTVVEGAFSFPMPFNQAFSANERMLLEHELRLLAQAQAHRQHVSTNRSNMFPTAAGLPLAHPGYSATGTLLGLGNFSHNLHGAAGPSTNMALDTAAAMLMAHSHSMSGRSQLSSALGMGLSGTRRLGPVFPPNNQTSMSGPELEALQFECLRAEQELSERRQILEMQVKSHAAFAAQQQRQASVILAAVVAGQQQVRTDRPQLPPPSQPENVKKVLLIQQGAACSVEEDDDSSSSSGEEEEDSSSSRASSPSSSTRLCSKQKQGEDSKEEKQIIQNDKKTNANQSSFSPIRKRAINKEKKAKIDTGHKNKSKWNCYFEALTAYKAEYGDCCVPRGFSDNPKLASWVRTVVF